MTDEIKALAEAKPAMWMSPDKKIRALPEEKYLWPDATIPLYTHTAPPAERDREDAERYRWLRNNFRRVDFAGLCVTDQQQLDARIDTARREGK